MLLLELMKKLIANDIIVITTGCSAQAAAKAGLLSKEAKEFLNDNFYDFITSTYVEMHLVKPLAALNKQRTNDIIACDKCLIQNEDSNALIQRVKELPAKEVGVLELEMVCGRKEEVDPRVRIFRLLAAMDCPILSMQPVQDSLEEVFLRETED